ncbi:septum formation protein [Tamilnaduibacter salinus]|uniref:dTTP/UTP pyrophosphatase n=1 Tax=Tamilnaduibacter salinus TaxID=1484056 RepID=A0A2U1CUL5_9GAMM|nr:Maf family protein [Tamilnaduibacter salinus]PVY70749.1 septum formation protein [Tamilnaduibacter salinus]
MSVSDSLILASASPRRRDLLHQIGLTFSVAPVDIDESHRPGEPASDYVERLAREKAEAGYRQHPGHRVLGSDTTVVLDGEPLGKPVDRNDALDMLRRLSGREHEVLTGVALARPEGTGSRQVSTRVCFRELSEDEMVAYWETGEPVDKAGGYGIQGRGGVFVSAIEGSYSNVVGLPLTETADLLAWSGMPVWQVWQTTTGEWNE